MAKRGRKPKPEALKDLDGNTGKRPRNKKTPKPADGVPTCPDHLGDDAKAEWDRIVEVLAPTRMLTQADRAALAIYCEAYGRWVEAETSLRDKGMVVKSTSGYPIQNPYLSIANKAMEQLRKMLAEFGLTPSSRSGMTLGTPKPDDDLPNLEFKP